MSKQEPKSTIEETSKKEQLKKYTSDTIGQPLTTDQGVRIANTDDSLKAGVRGPTLMEDFHFREKITHFDHERIPERVVHARGFGAHGYFQVYESMAEYTKARFLQDPSVKTPVFVRFSTVAGSRGSADTVRDVRGFAVKFYTEDGNYDLVGNNMPVFFIQDAIKFPDIIHAVKPEPHNEVPQASSAHDTFWDFVVSAPETAHMVMWLMSDRAIPRSFRMMEGFGVNTFRFVNDQGKARFVKFHWKPFLGVHSLVWDEAQKLSGKDPDFHRRDLWDAIDQGNYPQYELGVQMIEEDQEFAFDFDILDPTKLWPEELVPVKRIGKLTLHTNTDNFFAETEQVAFHPGNVVPGIDFSNDPLLQGRLFSYLDTQLTRLGGPNFHEIPINRPLAPVHNNQRDGMHRMKIDRGLVSYSPNHLENNSPYPTEDGYQHYAEKVDGRIVRQRSDSFNDHYSQAKLFWHSMSQAEKQHIIDAFRFEVGNITDKQTQQRVVDMFSKVSTQLAREIAIGIGATPPQVTETSGSGNSSPALSQENTPKSAATRKVAILAANGVSYSDLTQVQEILKLQGLTCEIISKHLGHITADDGSQVLVDKTFLHAPSVKYDAVYIPGGEQSTVELLAEEDAGMFVDETFRHAKTIGATNDGIKLLTQIKKPLLSQGDTSSSSSLPPGVVVAQNISDLTTFTKDFIDSIAQHRHWQRQSGK